MLEPSMLIGLGAVALWTYLRLPALRPSSVVRASIHLTISFVAFALLPTDLGFLLPLVTRTEAPYVGLALLMPTLTYLLLSWIWLLARILHDLFGGTPRGGHPVPDHS